MISERSLSDAERSSVAALGLASIGFALSIWLVFSSGSDTTDIRWWLVVMPLVFTAIPVLLPRHRIRLVAVIALGAWCVLTGFSIGMLLVPALVATAMAFGRET